MKLFRKTKKGMILTAKGQEEMGKLVHLASDIESMKLEMDRIKQAFKDEMEEREVPNFDFNNHYLISVRKPYSRIRRYANFDLLKEKGLYEKFVSEKEEHVESALIIKIHI